jgi:hypothetical protein
MVFSGENNPHAQESIGRGETRAAGPSELSGFHFQNFQNVQIFYSRAFVAVSTRAPANQTQSTVASWRFGARLAGGRSLAEQTIHRLAVSKQRKRHVLELPLLEPRCRLDN